MNNPDKLLDSADIYRLQSLLPAGIKDRSANLLNFLEDYYKYMNTVGPTSNINSLLSSRNISEIPDEYLNAIQDEIASYIPSPAKMDRRTLLKRIVKYFYNMRGSRESANVFFNLFYNTDCIISDPVPSSLISPIEVNQKSWGPYSYSIGVNLPVKEWEKPYRALIHPVGFRFYTADKGNTDSNGNNTASSLFLLFAAFNRWDKLKADAFIIENPDPSTSADIPYLYDYGRFQEFTTDNYYLGLADTNPYRYPASQPGWILPAPAIIILIETELGYLGRTHYDYDNLVKFYEENSYIGQFGAYKISDASRIESGNDYNTAQLPNLGSYIYDPLTTESSEAITTESESTITIK